MSDQTGSNPLTSASPPRPPNLYNRMEWAGAFGDLGTLIPFVVAYITLLKMDPLGILFSFALCQIAAGFYYRTPIPIQPMKAIGSSAITHAASITPGMVIGSGSVVGWLGGGLILIVSLSTTRTMWSGLCTSQLPAWLILT